MSVVAKFVCNQVTDYGNQKEVKFSAVGGKEGDNADFTKYTPVGEVRVIIQSDCPAANYFKPLSNYYLTFDEA